ncbi:MAG: hypothetical protein JWO47_570 [Candidatus Saccharibacteria bacterium]|nr:hypothetical protein [Candidatus Saccharibacteria bacterium]
MLKINKNQSGMAHIMIIMVVVILAAVGGVGYYVTTKNKDSSPTKGVSKEQAASDKAIADACNKELNDKDFCKFAANWSDLKNYKTTITSTSAEGTSTIVAETENADKSRVVTSSNGKEVAAYVNIGKDFYTKDEADGSWTKFTDDSTTKPVNADVKGEVKVSDFKDTAEASKTQYKKIGKEACQSLTCYKYQIIDSADTATEQFVWFDTKDFLLRRTTTKSADGTSDMVIAYGNISVSAPTPVKSSTSSSQSAADAQKQMEDAMKAMGSSTTDSTDDSNSN